MKSACVFMLCAFLIFRGENGLLAQTKGSARPPKPVIDSVKLIPGGDRWVQSGEELYVEMKGTPGQKAWFLDDRAMQEIRPGVYRGKYVVRTDDLFHDEPIEVFFRNPGSDEFVSAATPDRVRYLASDTSASTRKKRTHLYYGLGDDRLGGARMGSIDSGIRLRITGKTGSLFHVRLSPERDAWVAEEDLRFYDQNLPLTTALSGSWMIRQEGNYDVIRITLPQRVPYVSFTDADPATLTVDLFGAASNTNWITQRGPMAAIADTWYEQPSEQVFRIRIRPQHDQLWGYETGYDGNTFFIRVKKRPDRLALNGLTIMLDAGHGGTNIGAKGPSGSVEKLLTMSIVQKLGEKLAKNGATILYTRNKDVTVDMDTRLELVTSAQPDLLISVHCNSSANPSVQGTSSYYKHVAYRPLSRFIQAENLKLGLADFGNVGSFNFALNAVTACPNVLVETAFVSNPDDEKRLMDDAFQDELVRSIVKGVKNFVKAAKKNETFRTK
ncbi:MAG: N-acetylmuramoyl-L-alanine amidase [Mucilaginibacter polytrichastri]|nr:N-acetylmuramoyl-L-alanine amidase [Mucilaginibacter polytrichastri]